MHIYLLDSISTQKQYVYRITQMKQSVTTQIIVNHMFGLALKVVRITNDPHFINF